MKKKTDNGNTFKTLISFMKPYKGWIFACIVSMVASVSVSIYMGTLMTGMIDLVLVRGNDSGRMLVLFMVVIGIGAASSFFLKYSSGKFSAYIIRDIRHALARQIEGLKVSYMDKHHSGENISRMTNNTAVIQGFLRNSLADLFYHPLVFIGTFAYMLTISWKVIVACILIFPAMIFLSVLMSKPIYKRSRQSMEELGKANSMLQDAVSGFSLLKSFNMKDLLYVKFKESMDKILHIGLQIERNIAVISPIKIILQVLPSMICIVYGGFLIVNRQLTPGGLFTLIYLLQIMIASVSNFPQLITELQGVSGAAGHLFEILKEPVESRESGTPGLYEKKYGQVPVEFQQVSFTYDGQEKTLEKLSFTLNREKVTALVGSSGSGKSTVIKLVCGFYEPSCGCINLFGKPLEDWSLEEARKQLSVVSQDIFIFPASIAENISYGRPEATMEEIFTAAKAAGAHEFISDFPEGYSTYVGERGAMLSGGQKQRISLARAILKDAPILVLDEPTSALDSKSEAAILETINGLMKHKTILIVAHRLSTIINADKILVLDKGSIAEIGTHGQLLDLKGIYRQLYDKQFILDSQNNGEGELYA